MQRILCPIDLSERSIDLLKYAAAIQRWYGGCVTLLHVAHTMPREQVIEHMRQVAAAAAIANGHVSYETEAGDPAAAIVDRALALSADMIVVGTHAKRGIDGLVLGSIADSVLRRAPCDVLTIPAAMGAGIAQVRFSTIVCGVDFSSQSLDALRAGFEIAGRIDARVVLVHAIEWLAEEQPPDTVEFNVSDLRARLVYDAQQKINGLVDEATSAGRSVRTRVLTGRAYREVLKVACDEQADLIVVGRHGRSGAALPLVGSTAEQIVRRSHCPVLTVSAPHLDV
jgi:nucleotide-binding universal stress UspA family protein